MYDLPTPNYYKPVFPWQSVIVLKIATFISVHCFKVSFEAQQLNMSELINVLHWGEETPQ